MKLNKLGLALGLGLTVVAGSAFAADQGRGIINFNGSIIDAPCSVSGESTNQTVNLGQISVGSLTTGDRVGVSTPFDIKLLNCSTETFKTVQTTFTGAADNDILQGALGIEGIAKNAAVVITNAGGKQIPLGQPSEAIGIVDGDNTLNFAAHLQGSSSAAATPGSFTAIANFALTYQ